MFPSHDRCLRLASDDRRYNLLDVSGLHIDDRLYFDRLFKTIEEHYQLICQWLLSQVPERIGRPPMTPRKLETIIHSLDNAGKFLRYYPEILNNRYNQSKVYQWFETWCEEEGVKITMNRTTFYRQLVNQYHFRRYRSHGIRYLECTNSIKAMKQLRLDELTNDLPPDLVI